MFVYGSGNLAIIQVKSVFDPNFSGNHQTFCLVKVSDLILRTLGFTLGSMNVETIRFRETFELKLFEMKFLYN